MSTLRQGIRHESVFGLPLAWSSQRRNVCVFCWRLQVVFPGQNFVQQAHEATHWESTFHVRNLWQATLGQVASGKPHEHALRNQALRMWEVRAKIQWVGHITETFKFLRNRRSLGMRSLWQNVQMQRILKRSHENSAWKSQYVSVQLVWWKLLTQMFSGSTPGELQTSVFQRCWLGRCVEVISSLVRFSSTETFKIGFYQVGTNFPPKFHTIAAFLTCYRVPLEKAKPPATYTAISFCSMLHSCWFCCQWTIRVFHFQQCACWHRHLQWKQFMFWGWRSVFKRIFFRYLARGICGDRSGQVSEKLHVALTVNFSCCVNHWLPAINSLEAKKYCQVLLHLRHLMSAWRLETGKLQ